MGTPRALERRQLAEYIGRRVREIREEKGKSPAEIAWALRTSRQALWMIERDGVLQIDTLLRLALALGVDLMELLPPGYEDQLAPPEQVLEWFRRPATIPASEPAAKQLAGKGQPDRSSSKGSNRSTVTALKAGKSKATKRKTAAQKDSPTRRLGKAA